MSTFTFAPRRTVGLARFNFTLMVRNRTTMLYAFAIPLLPLALLFIADPDRPASGIGGIATALLMAFLFPGYYNLLSMFVTRRDELVLKRLRTGETSDADLIVSMALPGAAVVLAVTVLLVPIAMAAGFDLPRNPLLLLASVLLGTATFAAFALWTASWTRTAEAAQLTSGPVMLLALVGTFAPAVPESVGRWLELTPGAAVTDLVALGWFGLDPEATEQSVTFVESLTLALPAAGVLVAWLLIAVALAQRSMRWEPRA